VLKFFRKILEALAAWFNHDRREIKKSALYQAAVLTVRQMNLNPLPPLKSGERWVTIIAECHSNPTECPRGFVDIVYDGRWPFGQIELRAPSNIVLPNKKDETIHIGYIEDCRKNRIVKMSARVIKDGKIVLRAEANEDVYVPEYMRDAYEILWRLRPR